MASGSSGTTWSDTTSKPADSNFSASQLLWLSRNPGRSSSLPTATRQAFMGFFLLQAGDSTKEAGGEPFHLLPIAPRSLLTWKLKGLAKPNGYFGRPGKTRSGRKGLEGPVDEARNHRCPGDGGQECCALFPLHQLPIGAAPPFRKESYHLSVLEPTQGLFDCPGVTLLRANRDGLHPPIKPAEPPPVVH